MADTSHDDDDDVSSSGGDSVVDGPRRRRRGRAGRFRMDADGESEDVGSVNDDSNNKDGESTSDTSSTTESSASNTASALLSAPPLEEVEVECTLDSNAEPSRLRSTPEMVWLGSREGWRVCEYPACLGGNSMW